MSQPTVCKECGHEILDAQWPYCPHQEIYEQSARRFDPIRLHVSDSDPNQIQYPGRNDEAAPVGFHSVDITNIREADQWTRKINAVEREKALLERHINKAYFDDKLAKRRADTLARISGNPRALALFRAAQAWGDKQREKKYAGMDRIDPKFHIQALSFDSGNRNSYSGEDTNWRERKR